eukprot:2993122-Prymnesium_polylepis.1
MSQQRAVCSPIRLREIVRYQMCSRFGLVWARGQPLDGAEQLLVSQLGCVPRNIPCNALPENLERTMHLT